MIMMVTVTTAAVSEAGAAQAIDRTVPVKPHLLWRTYFYHGPDFSEKETGSEGLRGRAERQPQVADSGACPPTPGSASPGGSHILTLSA